MAEQYRVAVIGHTGQGNYGHGLDTVWMSVPQTTIVAVADPHEGGRRAARERLKAPAAYADYREMLEKERPQIVAICPRWLEKHLEYAQECARHGCHMYLEKPLCRDLHEADRIVRDCEMRHLKLAVAHTNRYTPQLDVARKLIADGAIGDVLEIRARGKEDRRGGGEDLWVLGTHMLDLMRAFAGDVAECYARVTTDGRPITAADVKAGNEGIGPLAGDTVEATYRFTNGITGFFSSHRDRAGRPSRFGLKVFGSKGVIEFESGYLKPAWILQDAAWSPGRTGSQWQPISSAGIAKPEPIKLSGHSGGNHAAVLDLLESIEKDRQPRSSMYDALKATEMIAGVFESQRVRGPVAFPLQNRRNPLTMLD